jgi:hypothetical protein
LVSLKANVPAQIPDTLLHLPAKSAVPHQKLDAIGFCHRLCSIIFPLYDS